MFFIFFILFIYSASLSANETPQKTDKAMLHAIHSEEVRNIMRRLKLLIYEREYTELELEKLRHQQIRLLVEEAKSLTITAAQLPEIESLKKLNEEEQLTFNAMANQLHDVALELQKDIEANHRQELDKAYIKLQDTCNTCHRLFRVW